MNWFHDTLLAAAAAGLAWLGNWIKGWIDRQVK